MAYRHKEKTHHRVPCPKYSGKNAKEELYLSIIEEGSLRFQWKIENGDGEEVFELVTYLLNNDNLITEIAQLAIRVWEDRNKIEENG